VIELEPPMLRREIEIIELVKRIPLIRKKMKIQKKRIRTRTRKKQRRKILDLKRMVKEIIKRINRNQKRKNHQV